MNKKIIFIGLIITSSSVFGMQELPNETNVLHSMTNLSQCESKSNNSRHQDGDFAANSDFVVKVTSMCEEHTSRSGYITTIRNFIRNFWSRIKNIFSFAKIKHKQHASDKSPIYKAIADKNKTSLTNLLKERVDISIKDKEGLSPLWFSVIKAGGFGIRTLIRYGANIHEIGPNGDTPLIYLFKQVNNQAKQLGKAELFEKWKEKVSKLTKLTKIDFNQQNADQETLLSLAVQNDNLDIVKYLVKQGAIVNQTILGFAYKNNHKEIASYLIDRADVNDFKDPKDSLLYLACANKDIDFIIQALKANAIIDKAQPSGQSLRKQFIRLAKEKQSLKLIEYLCNNTDSLKMNLDDVQQALTEIQNSLNQQK